MKPSNTAKERPALEILEQATHVLRTAGAVTLMPYFVGSVPFILGFLYFWMDMSRNPFAQRHVAASALGLVLLYLWMKHWQAVFTLGIRSQLMNRPPPALSVREHLRVFLLQAILQPSALVVVPLSLVPLGIPLPWTVAFYQNVSALADPESTDLSRLFKRAARQSTLAPLQNHVLLSLTAVFAAVVFINSCVGIMTIPALIKMLFGIESIFTRSSMAMLNTTFFIAMFALTYLCIDPLLKIVYALRCFHGEARESGEDIRSELRRLRNPTRAAIVLVLLTTLLATPRAGAQDAPATGVQLPDAEAVESSQLNTAINDVIQQRKYTWRTTPMDLEVEEEAGMVGRFFDRVGQMIRDAVRGTITWVRDIFRKLFDRDRPPARPGSGETGFLSQHTLMFVMVAVVLIALAIFLMRHVRLKKRTVNAVAVESAQPVPDVADENVAADQLPEDGWIQLGRELLERGEYRLAIRAFYLASLAHLAARNLIRIAQFKTNRDYVGELQRRAHALPGLVPLFGENLTTFERIWYGMHEATSDLASEFMRRVEQLRTT